MIVIELCKKLGVIVLSSKRKELQRARAWRYFLDATWDLIQIKGLNKITVREIADRAGYTTSSVYNYFKELSHVKFFAVMRATNPYVKDLPKYLEKGDNIIDKWLYAWECFAKHSYELPDIYFLLYVENLGTIPENLIETYYSIYEHEHVGLSDKVASIMKQHNISLRSSLYIQGAVEEGYIAEEDVEFLAETTMLIWTGMLTNYLNLRNKYSKEEVTKRTMNYVKKTIVNTVHPDKREQIQYEYGK